MMTITNVHIAADLISSEVLIIFVECVTNEINLKASGPNRFFDTVGEPNEG